EGGRDSTLSDESTEPIVGRCRARGHDVRDGPATQGHAHTFPAADIPQRSGQRRSQLADTNLPHVSTIPHKCPPVASRTRDAKEMIPGPIPRLSTGAKS